MLKHALVFFALTSTTAGAFPWAGYENLKVPMALGFAREGQFEKVAEYVRRAADRRGDQPARESWMIELVTILPVDKFTSIAYFTGRSRAEGRRLTARAVFDINSGQVVNFDTNVTGTHRPPRDFRLTHPTLAKPLNRVLKTIGYHAARAHRWSVINASTCESILARARETDGAEVLFAYRRRSDPRTYVDLRVGTLVGRLANEDQVQHVLATYAILPDGTYAFAGSTDSAFAEATRRFW